MSFKDEKEPIFDGLDIVGLSSLGSVYTLIVRGGEEKTREILMQKNPLILDFLSLTLEEIFIYETEAVGYAEK